MVASPRGQEPRAFPWGHSGSAFKARWGSARRTTGGQRGPRLSETQGASGSPGGGAGRAGPLPLKDAQDTRCTSCPAGPERPVSEVAHAVPGLRRGCRTIPFDREETDQGCPPGSPSWCLGTSGLHPRQADSRAAGLPKREQDWEGRCLGNRPLGAPVEALRVPLLEATTRASSPP